MFHNDRLLLLTLNDVRPAVFRQRPATLAYIATTSTAALFCLATFRLIRFALLSILTVPGLYGLLNLYRNAERFITVLHLHRNGKEIIFTNALEERHREPISSVRVATKTDLRGREQLHNFQLLMKMHTILMVNEQMRYLRRTESKEKYAELLDAIQEGIEIEFLPERDPSDVPEI